MPNSLSEKLEKSFFDAASYQTPTHSFLSHSTRSHERLTAQWEPQAGTNCRRYHGIMKRLSDWEREYRIKTTREMFGKAHLMAIKSPEKAQSLLAAKPTLAVVVERRRESDQSSIVGEFDRSGTMARTTRRNSSIRLMSGPQRESTAISSVKFPPIKRKSTAPPINDELSLNDLSPAPKPTKLHMIAWMSPQAQYSMLRSYDKLIREELLLLRVTLDGQRSAAGEHEEPTPAYLLSPVRQNRAPSSADFFFKEAGKNEPELLDGVEISRIRVAHFVEIAVKILNLIEASRKIHARRHDPNYLRYYDQLPSGTPSIWDDEDPFELYLRWAYLLNREFVGSGKDI